MSQKRCFSYVRFSTSEQAAGDSLRRQTELARRWAAANGFVLDESLTLRDLGVSAFKGANMRSGNALNEFHRAIEQGTVTSGDVLLLESLDRLSRDKPRQALRALERIVEAGVDVVTLLDNKRYTASSLDGLDLMMALVTMLRAHDESATKSVRAKAAIAALDARFANSAHGPVRHIRPGRKLPYWISRASDGRVHVDRRRGALVARTVRLYLSGASLEQIARASALGWTKLYVSRLLRQVARLPRPGRAVTAWPIPITPDDRARLARLLVSRSNSSGRPSTVADNLLVGLGKCGVCGARLRATSYKRTSKIYRYFVCTGQKPDNGTAPRPCKGPASFPYLPPVAAISTFFIDAAHANAILARTPDAGLAVVKARQHAERCAKHALDAFHAVEAAPSAALAKLYVDAQAAAAAAQSAVHTAEERARWAPRKALQQLRDAASDRDVNLALRELCTDIRVTSTGPLTGKLRISLRIGTPLEFVYKGKYSHEPA